MKLLELRVRDFRSLVDISVPLRGLNVMIGPNGAGKTALLETIQLLQRGSQQQLDDLIVEHGGIDSLINRGNGGRRPNRTAIELMVDVGNPQRSVEPMVYTVELISLQRSPAKGMERLEWQIYSNPPPLRYIDAHGERVRYFDPETKHLLEPDWQLRTNELALAQMPKNKLFQEPEAFRDLLASAVYQSFLDVSPRSPVRLPQALTTGMRPGPNGEGLYSALFNLRSKAPDIYERILALLEQAFPGFERIEFDVVGAGQVTLMWLERSSRQPLYPNQLSEGTLRFLWLVTSLLSPAIPPLLMLDEPEVSLHPELLMLLAAVLQDAAANSQVLVATHSPDLIRWLRPEQVLVMDKIDGATSVTWADSLNLDAWLEEYTLRDLWLMGTLGGRP
jgi:predicted ATPase